MYQFHSQTLKLFRVNHDGEPGTRVLNNNTTAWMQHLISLKNFRLLFFYLHGKKQKIQHLIGWQMRKDYKREYQGCFQEQFQKEKILPKNFIIGLVYKYSWHNFFKSSTMY